MKKLPELRAPILVADCGEHAEGSLALGDARAVVAKRGDPEVELVEDERAKSHRYGDRGR
jgi:hypothetical protein